jgi:hypothetical protein
MSYTFKVGQIAYINYSKKRLIIPVKVVEQIVRKTESQEIVDWNLLTPDNTSILFSNLNDPIFPNLDSAKAALLKSATSAIDKMSEVCLEIQEKIWSTDNSQVVNNNKNLDKIKVTLTDGTVANVSVPFVNHLTHDEQD